MEMHERLRAAREKLFDTAVEAARAMGVNENTYAAHENGSRGFGRSKAIKYAARLGVSLEYLLTGKTESTPRNLSVTVAESKKDGLAIKGFVRAGVWQESYQPERERMLPMAADVRYLGREQFALEVQGESMNRRVRPGSFVICVPWDGEPVVDRLVVVERVRAGLFEATLKVLRVSANGAIELWPDSNDPSYQTPIVLDAARMNDGDQISITAKVIGVYIPQ